MRWYRECESEDESMHAPYSTEDSIADPNAPECLNCSDNSNNDDNVYKVSWLVKSIIKSSQNKLFSLPEASSLDESLLLFRGHG
nr:unnamed protein product [Callosobruchus chinensis]